jgi:hypothetical protein
MHEFQRFRLDGRVALIAGGIGPTPAPGARRPLLRARAVTGRVLTLDGDLKATQ